MGLRKVERALAFLDGDVESSLEGCQVAIVREFEVVDTRHHTGEVVIGCIWVFAWATHNGEDGGETLESCFVI